MSVYSKGNVQCLVSLLEIGSKCLLQQRLFRSNICKRLTVLLYELLPFTYITYLLLNTNCSLSLSNFNLALNLLPFLLLKPLISVVSPFSINCLMLDFGIVFELHFFGRVNLQPSL